VLLKKVTYPGSPGAAAACGSAAVAELSEAAAVGVTKFTDLNGSDCCALAVVADMRTTTAPAAITPALRLANRVHIFITSTSVWR